MHDAVDEVIRIVCAHFGLARFELTSSDRRRRVARPRMMAMGLVRRHLGVSFPQIGRRFAGRHHTTVIHACNAFELQLRALDVDALALTARVSQAMTSTQRGSFDFLQHDDEQRPRPAGGAVRPQTTPAACGEGSSASSVRTAAGEDRYTAPAAVLCPPGEPGLSAESAHVHDRARRVGTFGGEECC